MSDIFSLLAGEEGGGGDPKSGRIKMNGGFSGATMTNGRVINSRFAPFTPKTTDEVPTMTSNTTPSGTANASEDTANAFKVFDKSNSTEWVGYFANSPWLYYTWGDGIKRRLVKYSLIRPNNYVSGINIKTWEIHGSNDGTNWELIHTKTDTNSAQHRDFEVLETTKSYLYFRLTIKEAQDPQYGYIKLGQWKMYMQDNIDATLSTPTLTPANLYEWGAVYFKSVTSSSVSRITLNVKDTKGNILMTAEDGSELKSISSTDYKTLILEWLLSTTDTAVTPELHPPHWTWIGT
jgi:hypothetical protein